MVAQVQGLFWAARDAVEAIQVRLEGHMDEFQALQCTKPDASSWQPPICAALPSARPDTATIMADTRSSPGAFAMFLPA